MSNYLFILFADPLDCTRDPCHLAWIIRDARDLLNHLDAKCSNGIPFKDLDPKDFENC